VNFKLYFLHKIYKIYDLVGLSILELVFSRKLVLDLANNAPHSCITSATRASQGEADTNGIKK
jgi:hypothetical protein